jgi:hypothetical protein
MWEEDDIMLDDRMIAKRVLKSKRYDQKLRFTRRANKKTTHNKRNLRALKKRSQSKSKRSQIKRKLGDVEEPQYTVLKDEKSLDIEVRQYDKKIPAILASDDKDCSSVFMKNFNYINTNKLPMTAPVLNTYGDDMKGCTMGFLELHHTKDDLPAPTDASQKVDDVKFDKVAVIKFSGWASGMDGMPTDKAMKKLKKLQDYLGSHYYQNTNDWMLAQYDEPWKLIGRRNEFMIPITDEKWEVLQNQPNYVPEKKTDEVKDFFQKLFNHGSVVKEPEYDVVATDKTTGIETREYKDKKMTMLISMGDKDDDCTTSLFMKNFGYINANKIPMSAPVVTWVEDDQCMMAFLMLGKTMAELPQPTEEGQILKEQDTSMQMMAIRFSGYATNAAGMPNKAALEKLSELQKFVGDKSNGNAFLGQYDDPMTPENERRNEFLMPLNMAKEAAPKEHQSSWTSIFGL